MYTSNPLILASTQQTFERSGQRQPEGNRYVNDDGDMRRAPRGMDHRQGTRGETTLGKCEQRSRTREHSAAQKAKHRDRRPNQHEGAPSGSNNRRSRFRQWGNAVAGQGVTQKPLRHDLIEM